MTQTMGVNQLPTLLWQDTMTYGVDDQKRFKQSKQICFENSISNGGNCSTEVHFCPPEKKGRRVVRNKLFYKLA